VSQEFIEQKHDLTKDCIERLNVLDKIRMNNHKDIIPQQNLQVC